jgi:hypothetical protein
MGLQETEGDVLATGGREDCVHAMGQAKRDLDITSLGSGMGNGASLLAHHLHHDKRLKTQTAAVPGK